MFTLTTRFFATVCLLLFGLLQGQVTPARHGMVVSDSRLASETGIRILSEGGNAIDAAVATAFVLAVTDPDAGNIGGGGFLVYRDSTGFSTFIDFREKAPIKAREDMFLDEKGELPDGAHHKGIRTIGVPGTVAGLYLAHSKYGRLPWRRLVQPAIDLARSGFPLPYTLFRQSERYRSSAGAPDFIKQYFTDEQGQALDFGDLWTQPELAATLEHIRDRGHEGFYSGPVAAAIDSFMEEEGGLIRKKDLRRYRAIERAPVRGTYGPFEIISMPPPSSGGVVLLEMLNMFESGRREPVELHSAAYFHRLIEIMRRAYADRADYLGDPDFNPDMPQDTLLSKRRASRLFNSIQYQRASPSDSGRYGRIYEGNHATHFSVLDAGRSAVSLTYTLEQSYGSKLGVPELGFLFNNEMGDFNPRPGYTDRKGLIGSSPNTIAPEKRMLSSMTPTIVVRGGAPQLVIGSPGGRTIINTVFQTLIAFMEYGLRVDRAIEAPKIHHGWLPDRVSYERDKLSPDTRILLEKWGHTLVPRNSLGALNGIQFIQEENLLLGASDSANPEGAAVGY